MRNEEYPALTVAELLEFCKKQVRAGNGEKKILISRDDEGNGYHGLFYQFTSDAGTVRKLYDAGLFADDVEPDGVVILG